MLSQTVKNGIHERSSNIKISFWSSSLDEIQDEFISRLKQAHHKGEYILDASGLVNLTVDVRFHACLALFLIHQLHEHSIETELITKVLTAEASGIIPAASVAYLLDVPLVVSKKNRSAIMEDVYCAKCISRTSEHENTLYVDQRQLTSSDVVLVVDDILARAAVGMALLEITKRANATFLAIVSLFTKPQECGVSVFERMGYFVGRLADVTFYSKEKDTPFVVERPKITFSCR